MRQLLLLRHAKSAWDDPGLDDHARPLNPRGRVAAAGLRGVMETVGLRPDLVLVSSARRTLQTLEALQPWPGPDAPLVRPLDALYLATAEQLFDAVRGVPPTARCVLVIGHNPGMHEFAVSLGGSGSPATEDQRRLREGFPTGALAEFWIAAEWVALAAGDGHLHRFVDPRDLVA